jgi:hypothetical protein
MNDDGNDSSRTINENNNGENKQGDTKITNNNKNNRQLTTK